MGARRKGREIALQTLYLADLGGDDPGKIASALSKDGALDAKTKQFTMDLIQGTLANKVELDRLIVKYSQNWELNRMAAIDRNLLRMSAYELIHKHDTPVSVIIDEAVEIAKTYSTPDSGKFVNGILDKIKTQRNENVNQP